MKTLVVVNPRAGSGKAALKGEALCKRLERAGVAYEQVLSEQVGDGARLCRTAHARGVDVIVAVGGDGTFNEAAQALIDQSGGPAQGPDLCLVPAGTASDLQRTLGLEEDLDRVVLRLAEPPRRVDLAAIEFTPNDGAGERRWRAFMNIASVGFSAVVASRSNRAPKWLGGKLTYMGAALGAALGYRNESLVIVRDGKQVHDGPVMLVAFCNGRYFGGGMKIAPHADPSDQRLDCVVIGDLNKLQTYALTSHMYKGTHVSRPGVEVTRGTEFEVSCSLADRRVEIEIDGETPGRLPARVRVLPGGTRLRC